MPSGFKYHQMILRNTGWEEQGQKDEFETFSLKYTKQQPFRR